MITAGTSDPAVFCNLGILCKNSGRINEALEYYEQALEFEPEDPQIYSNIGNLYRGTGNLDQALKFTLKSLDLDHESSTVQMNLGSIYRDLGKTDKALTATIKAIECDEGNIEALQNLKSLASDIKVNAFNRESANQAYEKLLNCDDFSHRKIGQPSYKSTWMTSKRPQVQTQSSQTKTRPFIASHQTGDSEQR